MNTIHIIILMVALILIVTLVSYAAWRNPRIRICFNIESVKNTKRKNLRPDDHTSSYPSAQIVAGEIRRSQVVNAGLGGNAEMNVGNIVGSTVVNAAGAINLDQMQSMDAPDRSPGSG